MFSLIASPCVSLFLPWPRIFLLLLLLAKSSLQKLPSDCEGPLNPKVVQSTSRNRAVFPASSVLILGEEDAKMANGKANYWLAEHGKTTGQGFTLNVDSCKRWISGCQIKNKGKGSSGTLYATREFKVSSSKNKNGPWQTLLEEELVDTTGGKAASLLDFTFDQPMEVQYLRFELVSYWGQYAGGLQYFAPIPASK